MVYVELNSPHSLGYGQVPHWEGESAWDPISFVTATALSPSRHSLLYFGRINCSVEYYLWEPLKDGSDVASPEDVERLLNYTNQQQQQQASPQIPVPSSNMPSSPAPSSATPSHILSQSSLSSILASTGEPSIAALSPVSASSLPPSTPAAPASLPPSTPDSAPSPPPSSPSSSSTSPSSLVNSLGEQMITSADKAHEKWMDLLTRDRCYLTFVPTFLPCTHPLDTQTLAHSRMMYHLPYTTSKNQSPVQIHCF